MGFKVKKAYGIQLSLVEIFKAPTIRQLALVILYMKKRGYKDIGNIEKKDYYEVSYPQKRLWFIQQLNPESCSYNMPGKIILNRRVDEERLKKVLYKIIERHESFRTYFIEVDNEPVQRIKETAAIPLRIMDIFSFAGEEKEQTLEKIYREEAQTPFDLSHAPLFRAILVKVSPERSDFIFNMHHIITDGWSLEILKKDFISFYEGFRTDSDSDIESERLALQYKDFSAWQNRLGRIPAIKEKALGYWRKKLAGGLPKLRLPYDFPGNQQDNTGGMYRCVVSRQIKDHLKTLAAACGTRLFTVLFSAFNRLLSQFTQQEDIVCRIANSGRDNAALRDLVGYFINPLIGINHVPFNDDFVQLLHRIEAATMEAFQYQDYPLEMVLEEPGTEYPDIFANFNMLNMWENAAAAKLENMGPYHIRTVTDEKFSLTLQLIEYKNCIDMYWRYKKALFKPDTIERMCHGYLELLEKITRLSRLLPLSGEKG